MTLDDLLRSLADDIGAQALGLAVVMPDGKSTFGTIVADGPEPQKLFLALSDELYKCAIHAATAATHKPK